MQTVTVGHINSWPFVIRVTDGKPAFSLPCIAPVHTHTHATGLDRDNRAGSTSQQTRLAPEQIYRHTTLRRSVSPATP
eukprot:COSAG06_NODE_1432_length_9478_cov_5.092014_8_plen_78_part_00